MLEFMKKFERLDKSEGSNMKLPLELVRLDSLPISLDVQIQQPLDIMFDTLELEKKLERFERNVGSKMKLLLDAVRLDNLLISLLVHFAMSQQLLRLLKLLDAHEAVLLALL
jgi:hypothetical protein